MNGVTAQSLREKGVSYHLNWGASLLHLQEMAREYEPSRELAILLWNDNIRECKILATMLMPIEHFTKELALQWIEQTPTQEIAEIASKQLFCKLPYAKDLAFLLLPALHHSPFSLIYAYCIVGSLPDLSEEEKQQAISHARSTIDDTALPLSVRHAAHNALLRLEQ